MLLGGKKRGLRIKDYMHHKGLRCYYLTPKRGVISFMNNEFKLEKLKIEFDNSGYFSSRVDSTLSADYRFDAVSKLAKELQC